MINIDFIRAFNGFSGLILISFVIFAAFEAVKFWFDVPEFIKKPFAIYLGVIAFIITSIIAYNIGNTTPIVCGLLHGFLYGILESSWFIFIKGISYLIENLISRIKEYIGKGKKDGISK